MAEAQYQQSRGTRDFRHAQRAYDKKVQKYALGKQSDAQVAELIRHRQTIAALQKQVGAAQGNDEKLAALKQAFADEDSKHKEIMSATADLSQYTKDFNEEAYDKEQSRKQAEKQAKKQAKDESEDTSETQTVQSKNIQDSSDERSGVLSTALNDSLSAYFQKQALGDTVKAPNSEHLRNQAEMHDKQAGDEQKNAQQNFQVANRNYRVEAEKNAASQAASENAQKIQNLGNVSAGAAALERGVKSADYNTHMQRQDQQRTEGVKNQREMWGAKQTAEEERADANKEDHDYLDAQLYNTTVAGLSRGGIPDNGISYSATKQNNTQKSSNVTQPAETEDEPAYEDETPSKNGWTYYDVQQAINILFNETGREGITNDKIDALIKERKPGVDPAAERARLAPLVEEMKNGKEQEYIDWIKSPEVRNGNVSVATSTAKQADHGDIAAPQQNDTISDTRQKNIISALSSIRF